MSIFSETTVEGEALSKLLACLATSINQLDRLPENVPPTPEIVLFYAETAVNNMQATSPEAKRALQRLWKIFETMIRDDREVH